jgi:hypothetical protein
MVRKCQKLIALVFAVSIIIKCQAVYAADVLYSVCYSVCGQEALLIGKVVDITSEKEIMKVEIVRLVSGILGYEDNYIDVEFNDLEKLDIGNEVLLSLECVNPDKSLYKIAYESGCYFVQCMDNRKIKLVDTLCFSDSDDSNYFDICLQWYCNTGEMLSEDDLSDTTKFYRWSGDNRELVYDQSKDIWYQDSFSSKFDAPDVFAEVNIKKNRVAFITIFGLVFLCGAILLYCRMRKNIKK